VDGGPQGRRLDRAPAGQRRAKAVAGERCDDRRGVPWFWGTWPGARWWRRSDGDAVCGGKGGDRGPEGGAARPARWLPASYLVGPAAPADGAKQRREDYGRTGGGLPHRDVFGQRGSVRRAQLALQGGRRRGRDRLGTAATLARRERAVRPLQGRVFLDRGDRDREGARDNCLGGSLGDRVRHPFAQVLGVGSPTTSLLSA
jgi:hypothetical protein